MSVEGEKRTGIVRNAQGLNPDTLHDTARGALALMSQAAKRTRFIARIFAETGIKDRYRKCALLYQKNIQEPFSQNVRGKDVQITPELLQGKIMCRVNMGISAQVGLEESQRIERMFAFLAQVSQAYPGLIGPQQIHNLATRYVSSMGFRQTEDFIAELQAFIQGIQQAMQANQQAQQTAQQVEGAKVQAEMSKAETAKMGTQVKAMEVQTKAAMMSQEAKQTMADNMSRFMVENMKIEQKDRDALMDFEIDLMKIRQAERKPQYARK
jgi:hypothetical protein